MITNVYFTLYLHSICIIFSILKVEDFFWKQFCLEYNTSGLKWLLYYVTEWCAVYTHTTWQKYKIKNKETSWYNTTIHRSNQIISCSCFNRSPFVLYRLNESNTLFKTNTFLKRFFFKPVEYCITICYWSMIIEALYHTTQVNCLKKQSVLTLDLIFRDAVWFGTKIPRSSEIIIKHFLTILKNHYTN